MKHGFLFTSSHVSPDFAPFYFRFFHRYENEATTALAGSISRAALQTVNNGGLRRVIMFQMKSFDVAVAVSHR